MRNTAIKKAKAKACYTCQECGSKELIHTHHEIPGDNKSIVVLCAYCHAKRHPDVPLELFLNSCHKRRSPYWRNKSAASLAKELALHPRTIIRRAVRLRIPRGELKPLDEELIKIKSCIQPPRFNSDEIDLKISNEPQQPFEIDLKQSFQKRFKLRLVGEKIRLRLPTVVLEREARARNISLEEFINRYGVAQYYGEGLPGIYIAFQEKEPAKANS
jgi:hypothetical protein